MKPSQHPFVSLSARCFCHATESEERVLLALKNVVGDVEVCRDSASGYHGNSIVVLSCRTGFRRYLLKMAGVLAEVWPFLEEGVGERLDEERWFHVRFCKQSAYLGELRLAGGEGGVVDVSLRVRAHPARRDVALSSLVSWARGE